MQATPEVMPSWFMLLAIGLAVFGLLIGGTVLLTFRGVHRPGFSFRSLSNLLLWVVPAVLIVGWFSLRASDQLREPASTVTTAVVQVPHETEIGPRSPQIPAAPVVQPVVPLSPVPTGINVAPINIAPVLFASTSGQLNRETLQAPVISSDVPGWVSELPITSTDKARVVISSQQFATLEEAQDQLTTLVRGTIQRHFHSEYPDCGSWDIPVSLMNQHLTHPVAGEQIDKDFGKGIIGKMYRVHAQLELSPRLRTAMHDTWRGQIVERRLIVIGSLLGLVTLMLATAAGYFKLDDLSFGMYRGRLKLAAVALIAAGSLVAAKLV